MACFSSSFAYPRYSERRMTLTKKKENYDIALGIHVNFKGVPPYGKFIMPVPSQLEVVMRFRFVPQTAEGKLDDILFHRKKL